MKQSERNIILRFRVSEKEKALIEEKMKLYGTFNLSAYLRKQAIDGYVIKLEFPQIIDLIRIVSLYCDRANNIARRVNETGRLYEPELNEIMSMSAAIRKELSELVERLVSIE